MDEKTHMSPERRQLRLILGLMFTLSVIVALIITISLYRTAFTEQRMRLVEIVQSQARFLEAVAKFDARYNENYPGGPERATIEQFREAHARFKGIEDTGEFTLARLVGDQVQFILGHGRDNQIIPKPVSVHGDLAEPMKRALKGESGTMIGLDYSGQTVLAAYEPVAILNLGLVAKVNLAEVRSPFIISGSFALLVALVFTLAGMRIISRLSRPIISRLEEQAADLRKTISARNDDLQTRVQLLHGVLEYAPDALLIVDAGGAIVDTNPLLDKLFGYKTGELTGEELDILIPHEFHQTHKEHHKQFFGKPNSRSMGSGVDLQGLKKDGSQFPVDISLSPIKTDSGVLVVASVRDISDSTAKIEGLRGAVQDAEKKILMMSKVFMDSADPIIIEDLEGNVIDLNREAEKTYGFPRDLLLGQSIKILVPSERYPQVNELFERCKRGEEVRNVESLHWDITHKITPVLLTLSQLKDDAGETIAIATIAKDISRQKHIEKELQQERQNLEKRVEERTKDLKESQQLLEAIIENCGAVIYLKDQEGSYQMVNKEWEALVGVRRETAIGKTDKAFWPAEADAIQMNDKEVLEKRTLLRREEIVSVGDTGKRTFLSFKIPMYDHDGKLSGLCGISTDITDEKNLQQELRDLNRNFIALLENIPDFLFIVDKDNRYLAASQSLAEITRHESWRDMLGKRDSDVFPAEYVGQYNEGVDSIFYDGVGLVELVQPYFDLNHKKRWLSTKKLPLKNESGEIIGLFGISRDITELRNTAEELDKAKLVAEAAAEAKSNFLASMSHEIRTPMNAIIGMVDILRQSKLDPEQKHMLHTISDSGQSLLTIINDILDFSKIEAGKLNIESISMSLTDVVEGTARTLSPYLKQTRLLTYVDPDLPQFIVGDPVRIRQILINLGGNAIKFSERGNVEIRAELLDRSNSGCISLQFRVLDKGIGISEELQQTLFESFTQAEASTTRKYGGTGLGLSICQRLTEMMGGVIGVNSEPGKGSEFLVRLELQASDKQAIQSKVRDLSGLRVLLIMDNKTESDIYTRYLEYWHAEVAIAPDKIDGLTLYESADEEGRPFNIVVLSAEWSEEEKLQLRNSINERQKLIITRFVSLRRSGRRNKSRLDPPNNVVLDVDPVGRAEFLSAVAIAAGRASPEVHHEDNIDSLKATRVPTIEEALEKDALVLVAEDNLTNQDVIRRQLNLFGYACELVDDGKQALEAWRVRDYALLLTDCHMPNMDGFELTASIRKEEAKQGKRTKIIAITANALQGEAERCIAAGMDDYLPKPVNMKELQKKLRKWMPHYVPDFFGSHESGGATGISDELMQSGEPIDEKVLKDMFGDDPEVFHDILNDFVGPSKKIVTEIYAGWEDRSADAVRQAAHKLKSAARSIGANELADMCYVLENAGKAEDWQKIDENIDTPAQLMSKVEDYIDKL